ncbi:MAG: HEAT repeat domain-containing protein, partial [Leptolyngbyaceae cyanobacterium MO_188.B28]|nr:HEAT repeat domain-containing protein [Leptolyngbyaceae cyanobacterium MO_188.B28]
MVNFEGYLQSLITTYEQWWKLYALTDAIGQIKGPERPLLFDFGLMVKTAPKRRDTAASETSPRQERQEKTERLPVLEGIRKYAENHVLLLGRPGSGKSTALIRLLLEMATEALEQSTAQIPILVELRYWQTNIFERIQAFLYKHDPYINFDDITLTSLLRKGRFLLLIDGLNELPSEEARSKLSTFRSDHPKVPMIFTTRDLGLGGDLGIEKQLEMQPLTETQMKVFIRAYVPEQEETMLRQLSDRLRELGQTPLLLWMLCEVFQQSAEHQIPSNLAGVFQTFTNLYEISSVRKHEVALLKGDVRPLSDRRLWKVSLQALASVMMQGETPVDHRVVIHRDEAERELSRVFPSGKLPTRDILDDLLKYHLLQNRSADQIEFRHQLIQEYYSAEYLLRRLPELNDEQLKRNYLNHLKWTEPIALMLALLDKDYQALRVVKLAMDDVDLMLGARLAGEVKSAFQKQTVDWVKQCKISHHLKILLLAVTSSQFSVPELLDAINNPITDISIAATNALGKIGCKSATPALLRLLENANTNYDPVAKSAAKAIGKIANRESIPRLVELLISKDFEAYQLARLALTEIGNEEVSLKLVEALRRCNNFEDCAYIASTLGDLGHSIAIPDLISFGILNSSSYEEIDDCGVQWSGISRSFENFGISVLPELISILENRGNYLAKIRSVRTIEQLKLREGIPAL